MSDPMTRPCTAFLGTTLLARGPLAEVALAARAAPAAPPLLVFDDANGAVIDLDLRGTDADVVSRLSPAASATPAPRPRGRPKLGVTSKEVTLLPRHWEWLSDQPGGASAALRRLVEQARRADDGQADTRRAQATAYRFMAAIAGDLPGFEEASRALFAGDFDGLAARMADWPVDVRDHVLRLLEAKAVADA